VLKELISETDKHQFIRLDHNGFVYVRNIRTFKAFERSNVFTLDVYRFGVLFALDVITRLNCLDCDVLHDCFLRGIDADKIISIKLHACSMPTIGFDGCQHVMHNAFHSQTVKLSTGKIENA